LRRAERHLAADFLKIDAFCVERIMFSPDFGVEYRGTFSSPREI
jgi:hypothetical protein